MKKDRMMKFVKLPAVIAAALLCGAVPVRRDVREFRSLEFQGLNRLSKYEIIGGVPMKATGKGLLIDMDSLRAALSKNPMIGESAVEERGGGLVITVRERVPAHLFAVRRGAEIVPFETDERFSIVSVRAVHLAGRPLVVLREDDLKDGIVSARAKRFAGELGEMERTNARVFQEILQIALENDNMLEIYLKGRKTRIIMPQGRPYFSTLQYLVSYLDGRNAYPGTLRIGEGYGVIE